MSSRGITVAAVYRIAVWRQVTDIALAPTWLYFYGIPYWVGTRYYIRIRQRILRAPEYWKYHRPVGGEFVVNSSEIHKKRVRATDDSMDEYALDGLLTVAVGADLNGSRD
jgi:hypothetical protein